MMPTDERMPEEELNGDRLPEEIDVEEIVAEVRAGLEADEAPVGEEAVDVVSLDRHLRSMEGTADVAHYTLGTGKSFAAGVLALKRVVEAVVRPYAGHFLDQQARFNLSVLRAIQHLGHVHQTTTKVAHFYQRVFRLAVLVGIVTSESVFSENRTNWSHVPLFWDDPHLRLPVAGLQFHTVPIFLRCSSTRLARKATSSLSCGKGAA